jgi:DNA segregation ATPase FtsK/SpoIIIE, S-DNA-T family
MANAAALSKPSHAAKGEQGRASDVAPARNLNRDVGGLAIAAITLMLLISVITRDPRDPITTPAWPLRLLYTPDVTHYPLNDGLTNACGYWGAFVSGMLIDAVGISLVIVIAATGSVAWAMLGRGVHAPALRSLGATVMVLAISTAGGLAPLRLDGFPAVGAGGYLGAMTSSYLQEHFALPGAWILTLTVLLIGLMMTTDYALWYAGAKVLSCGALVSRRGFETVHEALPGRKAKPRVVTDLDSPIAIADGLASAPPIELTGNRDPREPHEPEPTIKVRKRPKAAAESDDAQADQAGGAASGRTDLDGPEETEDQHLSPAKRAKGKVAAAAAGLAGIAAAVGLAGKSPAEDTDALDSDADEDDGGDEELTEPLIRELEVDGELRTLRGDEAHDEVGTEDSHAQETR